VSYSGALGHATVPTTIARVVTIDELVELFILATSATLCGGYRRQGRQQKQTQQHQDYLAITFHQPHNTSNNPNCNPVRREYITTSMPGDLNREQRVFGSLIEERRTISFRTVLVSNALS